MKRRSTYRRQCREKMAGENLSENSMEAVLEPRSERHKSKSSRHRRSPALKEKISDFIYKSVFMSAEISEFRWYHG